ncbi:hypothetical protein E4H12_02265 [Candidatus Thorarchaeota archaeon]|nr:MAG: hypothetical protein E4H12_02265 [Candidatus Thorarchaeota archaeon]
MNTFLSLFSFTVLLAIILVIAVFRIGLGTVSVRGKMRNAQTSPWDLHEFLSLNPSKPKHNDYYRFSEESVRSHAHRFVGRFDGAILHWEEAPILDMIVENKFPVNYLPEKERREDIFQAGLYALALAETGVSCKDAKLVIIYCLQDVAKRCVNGNLPRRCSDCGEGKIFSQNFNQREIMKTLTKIDEVWYKKRQPRASPSESNCRLCPYSKDGKCNHSAV